jgi:hypothetical protein
LGRGVGDAVDSLPAVRHIGRQPLEPKLRAAVGRELGTAWNTESGIRVLPEIDPSRLPSLLRGATVNSYFAIYHGARAWIAASGQPQRTPTPTFSMRLLMPRRRPPVSSSLGPCLHRLPHGAKGTVPRSSGRYHPRPVA